MKSLIFPLTLLFSLTALAQQRGSILDDPDFLKNLGLDEVEQPSKLGAAPCMSCGKEAEEGRIIPFRKERKAFTFPRTLFFPADECAANVITDTGNHSEGPPAGAYICMGPRDKRRDLYFRAEDGARDGAYLYFNETISDKADSGNVKTAVLMLPRKSIPNLRLVGRELHLTLSTGELVVLDAVTKQRIRGPLSFGPLSTVPKPTPFTYTGSAIVISGTQKGKSIHPFQPGGAAIITVRQGNQSCTIAQNKLWNAEGTPISSTDAGMVATLNQHCTPKPAKQFTL